MRRMLGATSVLEFAREVLKFPAEGTQAAVLENAPRYKTIVLNCSRQWGRSTVVAAMAVYRMIKVRGATVLIVAPVGRQSGETLAKARGFLRVMGLKWKSDGVNDQSSMLANGSRIVSLPATRDTLRGYSAVSMLIIDEAAYVEDEVYLSLRPSLAVSDGDLILLSTPCGRRGFF
jgi:phage terminase large subunit-like protein